MLHDPDLLILDEPTDGLDPMGRSQIRDLLAQLKSRGKTVFLNSHILQEVELICDRVAIMALGEIRGVGTIDELIMQNPLAKQGTVNLTLRCTKETIDSLSQRWTCSSIRQVTSTEEEYKVDLAAPHQSDVDQVVDWLRSQQISVVGLERYRPSLEQVFMSIVGSVPSHLKT
jgi:ABC-2 type transport system ATP-binding protein